MTLAFCREEQAATPLEIASSELQSFTQRISQDLEHSPLYQQAISELTPHFGAASACQALLKAVAQEAVRLAFRQWASQPPAVAEAALPAPETPIEPLSAPVSQPIVVTTAVQAAKANAVTSKLEAERQVILQQIGQQFRTLREQRQWSLQQMHSQTWVPLHHLKALEAGIVDRLPEDIYVRGFVRRVGNALGLDGVQLAATIPVPAEAKTVIPSWQRSMQTSALLSPKHLYFGYAALAAGAIGGFSWMTQPHTPVQESYQPQPDQQSPVQPAQQTQVDTTVGAISPPEMLMIK